MNDYYETLGVTCDTNQDEVREAYHREARQLHPDCAGPESEEAFKGLSIAYEVLSSPEKCHLYDVGDADVLHGSASPFQGAGGFSDFFDAMFSGFSGASPGLTPRRRHGAGQLIGADIILKETVFGTQKIVSFATYIECETRHGSMCVEDIQPVTCSNCDGSGMATWISSTMFGRMQSCATCEARGGYGTIVPSPYQECAGQGRTRSRRSYLIDIPADVTEGMRVRVPGKTEVGPSGGSQGDLYLEVRELTDEVFVRHRDDLHM